MKYFLLFLIILSFIGPAVDDSKSIGDIVNNSIYNYITSLYYFAIFLFFSRRASTRDAVRHTRKQLPVSNQSSFFSTFFLRAFTALRWSFALTFCILIRFFPSCFSVFLWFCSLSFIVFCFSFSISASGFPIFFAYGGHAVRFILFGLRILFTSGILLFRCMFLSDSMPVPLSG